MISAFAYFVGNGDVNYLKRVKEKELRTENATGGLGKMMCRRRCLLFIFVMLLAAGTVNTQTTEFTYQGRLLDGSVPPTANYDLEFRLFSAETGGTLLGSESRPAVAVANGVFTVRLNFGSIPASFDGADRWLEIAVRPAGGPTFTTLNPRQPVSSAPYSIRSLNSNTANTATNSAQLGGVAAGQYVITTDPRMTDARTPTAGSADYIQNTVATQASSNFNISGNGMIGGNLGVGTTAPGTKLDVSGNGIIRARVNSDSNAGFAINLNNQPGWSVATTTGGQFQIFNDALVSNAVWIDPANNNVGIGTIAPGSKLDVAGSINTASQYNIGGSRILSNPGSINLFAGVNAGFSNGAGAANTFVGDAAGRLNVNGNGNSYFGRAAGENSTGGGNSFVGVTAGQFATSSNSAYFGAGSGRGTSTAIPNTGSENAFFGYQSGMVNTSGNLNAFFGSGSGRANTTGFQNSFFGGSSGQANVNGIGNSFFGMNAGEANTGGSQNAFFGSNSGTGNTTGNHNVFLGTSTGIFNSTGHRNTFLGTAAGQNNTTGVNNTGLGFRSNVGVGDLAFATAIGSHAVVGASDTVVIGKIAGTYDGVPRPADTVQIPGDLNVAGTITGTFNGTIATANNALNLGGIPANQYVQTNDTRLSDARAPLPGSTNYIQNSTSQQASSNFNVSGTGTAGIFNALTHLEIGGNRILSNPGFSNLFAGRNAGNVNTGSGNAFFGSDSGTLNQNGVSNTFVGSGAGQSNVSGSFNAFFGAGAGRDNTATENSFFGYTAGANTTAGSENSFFGRDAGNGNTIGAGNSFLGKNTGNTNTTGNYNTALGYDADLSAGNLTNANAIGSRAFVSQSNSLVLGSLSGVNGCNSGFPTLCESVKVGIGITAPTYRLHVIDGSNAGLRVQTNAFGGTVASFGGNGAFQIDSPGTPGGRFTVLEDGRVGIGTDNPTFKLHVHVIDESNTGLRVQTDTTGGAVASFGGNGAFQIDSPGTPGGRFTVLENGRVGIGTNNPTRSLEVTGVVAFNLASGGGTNLCHNFNSEVSTCSSSIRYKQNVKTFDSGLDLISRLRPITFNWKADDKLDMGLVAEEVAEVEPLLATYNDKGEIEGVKYDRIGVVLINVVKEQQAQIEAQRKLIEQQQRQIDALKKLVCTANPTADICTSQNREQ